jgi:hypothetical protein
MSVRRALSCFLWLKQLDTVADLVKLFEDAFKQQPDNEELGRQAFFANVRAGNWKAAQLVRFFYALITSVAPASCETIALPVHPHSGAAALS